VDLKEDVEINKEDIEIYKILKNQKNKLSSRFAIGILLLIFGLPWAFVINVWFGIASLFILCGYLIYLTRKWKEFEETAISLGYDVTAWGDLKRIK